MHKRSQDEPTWTHPQRINSYIYLRLHIYIDGLIQDCSISIANALEILQSCTKPSTFQAIIITYDHLLHNQWPLSAPTYPLNCNSFISSHQYIQQLVCTVGAGGGLELAHGSWCHFVTHSAWAVEWTRWTFGPIQEMNVLVQQVFLLYWQSQPGMTPNYSPLLHSPIAVCNRECLVIWQANIQRSQ